MRIRIEVDSTPSEYSTHLRRGLAKLVSRLGFTVSEMTIPKGCGSREWTVIEVWGDAPDEQTVDKIFSAVLS